MGGCFPRPPGTGTESGAPTGRALGWASIGHCISTPAVTPLGRKASFPDQWPHPQKVLESRPLRGAVSRALQGRRARPVSSTAVVRRPEAGTQLRAGQHLAERARVCPSCLEPTWPRAAPLCWEPLRAWRCPFRLCFASVLFTLKQETSVAPSFTYHTQDINIQHFICPSPGQEHDSSLFNMKPVFVAWAFKLTHHH